MQSLDMPIRVYNVDGTLNQGGSITHEVTLMMSHKGHKEKAVFEVCDLGKSTVIIGYTWLQKHNPMIDWKTGDIKFTRCSWECNVAIKKHKQKKALAFKYKALVKEVDEEAEEKECEDDEETEDDIYLWVLEHIREVEKKKVEKKTDEEMVPPQFHVYLDVFKKTPSERLPLCKPWDHAIDLNPDFVPRKSKLYPMSPTEQQEVRDFIDDQLKKGYIPRCFSFPRKMERNKWYRIIVIWTKEQLRIIIHYCSLQSSLIVLDMRKYLQNWIFDGAITMSASKKKMNGRQHSPAKTVHLNL